MAHYDTVQTAFIWSHHDHWLVVNWIVLQPNVYFTIYKYTLNICIGFVESNQLGTVLLTIKVIKNRQFCSCLLFLRSNTIGLAEYSFSNK